MDSPDQAERSHAHGLQVGVSGGDFEGGAEDLCSYELRHLVVGKRGQGPLVGRGGRSGRASEDAGGGDGWRWREVRRRDGMGGMAAEEVVVVRRKEAAMGVAPFQLPLRQIWSGRSQSRNGDRWGPKQRPGNSTGGSWLDVEGASGGTEGAPTTVCLSFCLFPRAKYCWQHCGV